MSLADPRADCPWKHSQFGLLYTCVHDVFCVDTHVEVRGHSLRVGSFLSPYMGSKDRTQFAQLVWNIHPLFPQGAILLG